MEQEQHAAPNPDMQAIKYLLISYAGSVVAIFGTCDLVIYIAYQAWWIPTMLVSTVGLFVFINFMCKANEKETTIKGKILILLLSIVATMIVAGMAILFSIST